MPYRKPQIGPPWGGWLDGLPSVSAKASSFKQITNWLINKGRIQSGFNFNNLGAVTSTNPILRMRSFQDVTGGWHTVAITSTDFNYWNGSSWIPLDASNLIPFVPAASTPWAIEIYQNVLYFSAGLQPLTFWTGGGLNIAINPDFYYSGDVPGGCLFLGKLDARLIMLNTFENTVQYPRRVRWCGINNPTEWNPIIDPSSGATDIPEVEDQISGWSVAYNIGFIYRSHGITTMSPTGNPSIPFLIQSFENGPKGVGVYTPYSLASWGTQSAFRSEEDIYSFDGSNLNPIGGSAKKSIIADVENSVSQVSATMIGRISPTVDYLSYWLICPQANGITNLWVYHYDDQSWVKIQAPTQASSGFISSIDNIYTS
jgi:hypothetical protein